jgi:hypothetical protein
MPPSSCVAMSRRVDAVSVVEGGRGLMIYGEPSKPPEKRVAKARLCYNWPASQKLFQKYPFAGGILANQSHLSIWRAAGGPTWEFAASGICSLGQGLLAALFTCYLTFNSHHRRVLPLTYLDGLSAPFNPFVALFRWVIAEI